jgi:hypothetical protein
MIHYTIVFITVNALHVSGGSSAHASGKKQKKLDKYVMLYIQF